MKTFNKYAAVLLVVGVLFSAFAYGVDRKAYDEQRTLRKPLVLSSINFDGNRVDNDLQNNGMIVSHNVSGRSGLSWPKGNGTQTIYASGVWLGAIVNGQPRVTVGEFNGELVGGPYGSDPSDPYHKLYKVSRSDWDDPAASDDFQNWPAHQGAPFVDVNENGTYEPLPGGTDYPDFPGDQVVWAVMNDGDPTAHSVFATPPLGIEVQMTIFGFDRPDAFGDMMFIKELIINRGDNTLNDAIIGLWSDPDLGDASDDLVGCDTTLGMGICYNAGDDVNFAGYVDGTPAVAYDFFQGPMVPMPGHTAKMFGREIPDMMNLKMTSFTKYINPDPVYYDPNNAEEAYNYMQGLLPDGSAFPFAASGGTPFVHPGDPTLDTGPDDTEYVDSDLHPPDDRRFLMNAGPFTMAPGDSQEVVFGIFHAANGDALDSYRLIKVVDAHAQFAYDSDFILPSSPDKPEVETTVYHDEIILKWNSDSEIYSQAGPDSPAGDETTFEFEGYNIYQYETATGNNPVKIATYDVINNVNIIKDDIFVNSLGEIVNTTVQNGSDSGLKRSISITQDYTRQNVPLVPQRAYYFGVTAYSYNEFASPKVLESAQDIITVRPQAPQDWAATDETAAYGTSITADHASGGSDGSVFGIVVDPQALTGDDYEVFFGYEDFYRDVDGVWKAVNGSGKDRLAKILDCTGSVVTVAAVASANVGTVDLEFHFDMHCGSNWVDGLLLDFPDGVVINSWDALGDCSYPDFGQNCVNMDGTYDAATNSLLWGDNAVSAFGAIEGSHTWVVNIDNTDFPLDIGYEVYDDQYDGTKVDAVGTATADELGYVTMRAEGWWARNLNTGEVVTPLTTNQSGFTTDNVIDGVLVPAHEAGADAYPIAEGLQFVVNGPALTMKWIGVVSNAAGPLDPPREGLPYWRYPNWLVSDAHDYSDQQTNGATWVFNTHPNYGAGGEATFLNSLIVYSGGSSHPQAGVAALIPDDLELRFTADGGVAYDNWTTGTNVPVPFEWWNIGSGTPDDASDDYRLVPWLLDDDGSGDWNLTQVDHETSSANNDPYTDRVYVHAPLDNTPGEQGYNNYIAATAAGAAVAPWHGRLEAGGPTDSYNVLSRTVLMNWNGGDVGDATWPANVNAMEPETGTTWRFVTTKPNTATDKFQVATADVMGTGASFDSDNISVWPNPYFGFNPEERDPVDNQVHFTGLPVESDCVIRIFDLAGVPVKTINHDAGSSLEIWNIKNDSNIPVASGMYIAVIETDSGTKILKIAIIQPEQRLDLYG